MNANKIVDECQVCRHYKLIDRQTHMCRACLGRADRDMRLRLYQITDHQAMSIDKAISHATRQAATRPGDYMTNLKRALTEQGCTITRMEDNT